MGEISCHGKYPVYKDAQNQRKPIKYKVLWQQSVK